jgi:stearoyl-CoA desaturase (Delta-9 desaturase)
MNESMVLWNAFVTWVGEGLLGAAWWQIVLYTLVFTHITIASVTIFLHRAQAHRALDLHPIASHFFRLWLWIGTGMVTKEWVAIHRKHHAKCETEEDPHSPQTRGIKTVLLEGSELYRTEAKNQETLAKYGHNTPDDWIERHVYSRYTWQGVGLTLILDLLLFGGVGAAVWAVQMLWIPITAAGIINGIGHYWGYRNFEAPDASRNIVPWGIVIGGEELHNNHHTYPTSAKLSVKSGEFDIGWAYIRMLQAMGLATVRKIPPQLKLGEVKQQADAQTLDAVIANRYEVMAQYAKQLKHACGAELVRLKEQGGAQTKKLREMRLAKRWLHRDDDKIPSSVKADVQAARAAHPVLDKLVTMREELRALWTRTGVSAEQLVADLQAWCKKAEESGIASLQAFALQLRAARA